MMRIPEWALARAREDRCVGHYSFGALQRLWNQHFAAGRKDSEWSFSIHAEAERLQLWATRRERTFDLARCMSLPPDWARHPAKWKPPSKRNLLNSFWRKGK
jgi:hypothetical protein